MRGGTVNPFVEFCKRLLIRLDVALGLKTERKNARQRTFRVPSWQCVSSKVVLTTNFFRERGGHIAIPTSWVCVVRAPFEAKMKTTWHFRRSETAQ